MADDGRLKGVKTKGEQGHWRFKLSDVEKFMHKQDNSEGTTSSERILDSAIYILDTIPNQLLSGNEMNNRIWNHVNKYFGIRSVFGSYAIHSEMDTYREIINRKGFVWLGEGAANFMEDYNLNKNKSEFFIEKIINHDLKFAFGVVKYPSLFQVDSYSLVSLLVVKDKNNKEWVVDGTLQQFYPNLEKGLVVFPMEKAKELYLYNDPHISDKFISKATKLVEKDDY